MSRRRAGFAGIALWTLAGCSTVANPTSGATGNDNFSHTLFETAAKATVAKLGVKVCRELTVGIAEQDWVRGVVEEVSDGRVGVRIVDAGRFPHIMSGIEVTAGAVVWDTPSVWTPCY